MIGNDSAGDVSRPASVLNLIAGVWLIVSPWALGFAGLPVAAWNTVILGIAVLILAAVRLGTAGTQPLSWLNFVLGCWLIISPFVLQFTGFQRAMGNDIILGCLVAIFALWAALGTTARGPFNRTTPSLPR